MPEYLSPGVYVEEISLGPKPIEGVSTSTAGMAGQTERGPTAPRLVTSWLEFQRWYGGHIAESYLPYAVQGFFDNGGQRVFVARVVGAGVAPAPGATSAALELNDANGDTAIVAQAIGPGTWGNNMLVRVSSGTQANLDTDPPRDLFRLTIIYYRNGIPDPFVDPLDVDELSNPRRVEPDTIEDYDNLSTVIGSANYAFNAINSASRLLQVVAVNGRPVDAAFTPAPPAVRSSLLLDTADDNTQLRVEAISGGVGGDNLQITVEDGTAPNTFRITVGGTDADGNAVNEPFDDLTEGDVEAAINGTSAVITVSYAPVDPANPVTPARPDNRAATNLAGGADAGPGTGFSGGTDVTVTVLDYIGDADRPVDERTGLVGLEAIDEVSLLCAPDEVNTNIESNFQITNALVDQCERLKDRFAILNIAENEGNVATIRPPRDSHYGAVYYPWVRLFDPRTLDTLLVPPAGHVAGVYARTDIEQGVHKAPANAVLRGIVNRDLSGNRGPLKYRVTKGQHDLLNPRGVNVIRDFRSDGRDIRIWGARTMSSDPEWRYVNVRRLFLFVEESIDQGTQWVVFEPNHDPTWAKVRRSLTNFLISVWHSGALMGLTQDEAFFVKCDRTTMSQDDIDNGRLICYIGIAPVKPAEFVIFRISQKTADAQ